MDNYNSMELMICAAARYLEDGKLVSVGTGAPCAAAMLAQKRHAPQAGGALRGRRLRPAAAHDAHLCGRLPHHAPRLFGL